MGENPIIEFLIKELKQLQEDLKNKWMLNSIYQVSEGIFTFAWSDNVSMQIYTVKGFNIEYTGYPDLDTMEYEPRLMVTKKLTEIEKELKEMIKNDNH